MREEENEEIEGEENEVDGESTREKKMMRENRMEEMK